MRRLWIRVSLSPQPGTHDVVAPVLLQSLRQSRVVLWEAAVQADAVWNNSDMKAAWVFISRPPILLSCPFRNIAIAS